LILRQQFFGVRARFCRDFMSAEHSCQLFDSAGCIETRELGRDAFRIAALGHPVMAIGASRHLRQMRDAQNLPPRAELP
jgi:hypothetical protein